MRILVVSDTHNDYYTLNQVIKSQTKAEIVIHLGDGEEDIERIRHLYDKKMIVSIRGNCDWGSNKPYIEELNVEGKKIFATHGHLYSVKVDYDNIINEARKKCADILLFGHTHIAYCDYIDGLYIMNPGALRGYNASYGIIDICNNNIITNLVKMKEIF